MRKLALVSLFLLLLSGLNQRGYSQDLQTFGIEDAQRGNRAVGGSDAPSNSGRPSITVPLASAFPVSLSYDASGCRPDAGLGTAGLGWSLQAGGEVTRIVHGMRDERSNMRPGIKPFHRTAWQNFNTNAWRYKIVGHEGMLDSIKMYNFDTAADEFRYNIIGRSGVFLFKRDGSVLADRKIRVRVLFGAISGRFSHDDDFYDNYKSIAGIVITFEDGVECAFKAPELTYHRYVASPNGINHCANPVATSVNKWKITRITYPGQALPITFEYYAPTEYESKYTNDDQMVNNGLTFLTATNGVVSTGTINVKTIRGPGYRLEFSYHPSLGLLDIVSSYSAAGTYLNGAKLTYTSVSATKKLLARVELAYAPNAFSLKNNGSYRFEYNTNQVPPEFQYFSTQDFFEHRNAMGDGLGWSSRWQQELPAPINNTAGVDHWGFYNGVKPAYQTLVNGYSSHPSAANQYSITGLSLTDREPNPTATQALVLQKIIYPTGGFVQYVFENNDYSYITGLYLNYNSPSLTTRETGGGLRIKQIIRGDGISAGVVVKTYEYRSAADATLSSGVLENEPMYDYNGGGANYSGGIACDASTSLTLTLPSPILPTGITYSTIKETQADGSFVMYYYSTAKEYPGPGVYGAAMSSDYTMHACDYDPANNGIRDNLHHDFIYVASPYAPMRGLMQRKEEYTLMGNLLKRTTYTYSRKDVGSVASYEQLFKPTKPYYCNKAYYFNPMPVGYKYLDWYFCRIYDRAVTFPVLESVEERVYDQQPGTAYREAKVSYTYNPDNYRYATVTKVDHAELNATGTGVKVIDEYYYPTNYNSGVPSATALKLANRLTEVLERRTYRNGKIVAGELSEYGIASGSVERQHLLTVSTPLAPASLPFNASNQLANSQYYKLQGEVQYNQETRRVELVKPQNALPTQTIYGHNGLLPVATVTGPTLQCSRVAIGALAAYSGSFGSSQTVLTTITADRAMDISLDVQLNASTFKPFNFYVENVATGERLLSELFLAADEGIYGVGTGTGWIRPLTVSVSPGQYRVVGQAVGATTSAIITPSLYEHRPNAFYTSFEDFPAAQTANGGKTGTKCWPGSYGVKYPAVSGDYVLSYWLGVGTAGAQTWTYQQSSITVTAGNANTTNYTPSAANAFIDEVRLYPAGAIMTTQNYQDGRGVSHAMNPNGIQQVAEYDEFGRVKLVRNDDLDIMQRNQYQIGTP